MTGTSLWSRSDSWTHGIMRCTRPRPSCLMYKIWLQVTLGQKKGQAMRVVSRCLWDTHSDSSASELYENETLYCVCQASDLTSCSLLYRLHESRSIIALFAKLLRSTSMANVCRSMVCTMNESDDHKCIL